MKQFDLYILVDYPGDIGEIEETVDENGLQRFYGTLQHSDNQFVDLPALDGALLTIKRDVILSVLCTEHEDEQLQGQGSEFTEVGSDANIADIPVTH